MVEVDSFLLPSTVCCCVKVQTLWTLSETSATATLISEEELPESSWAEFLRERGSLPLSQGHTSSDVDAPATMAILGFFTLIEKYS